MDGTNAAQIAALDLGSDLYLADSFEHTGLGGIVWTLLPSDDPGYKQATIELLLRNPRFAAISKAEMKSEVYSRQMEKADAGFEAMRKMLFGENGHTQQVDGQAAVHELFEQYRVASDSAKKEAENAIDDVDLAELLNAQREVAATNVVEHLVVRVDNAPGIEGTCENRHTFGAQGSCPECGGTPVERKPIRIGGGPELAAALFAAPKIGHRHLQDVIGACDRFAAKALASVEDHAKNS